MRPGSGFCALMLPRIRPYRLCVARFELKEHKPPDKPGAPVQPFLIAVMQPERPELYLVVQQQFLFV